MTTREEHLAWCKRRALEYVDADACARCGYPRKEHTYNGACYGLCGKFEEPAMTDIAMSMAQEQIKELKAEVEQLRADSAYWRDRCQAALAEISRLHLSALEPKP